MQKAEASADARIEIDHIHWYVPRYTPSIQQQSVLSNQVFRKTPTELEYVERFSFVKKVNNQNLWNIELESKIKYECSLMD